jgi:hypothetical protein
VAQIATNDFGERTDMKKILTGAGLMILGFVTWVGCAYIRPGLFGISLALAINSLILVFLGGFVLVLVGTGLILVRLDLWGY